MGILDKIKKIFGTEYDENGFNQYGYDKNGYDRFGYDKFGYDRDGFNRNGYNHNGDDKSGYNKSGYNRKGYCRDSDSKKKSREIPRTDTQYFDRIEMYENSRDNTYHESISWGGLDPEIDMPWNDSLTKQQIQLLLMDSTYFDDIIKVYKHKK